MFCHKCGAQMVEGASFCQKCGTKVVVDEAAAQSETTSMPANQVSQPGNTPVDVLKKKKSKKLPICLAAIVLVLAVIFIASNSNDLTERSKHDLRDEEYINSHQTGVLSEAPSSLDTSQADVSSEAPPALDTTDRILIGGIPIENVMEMTADEVIAAFGEPEIYLENNSIEYSPESTDWMEFGLSANNMVYSFTAGAERFSYNGQGLNMDVDALVTLLNRDFDRSGGTMYSWSAEWEYEDYTILVQFPQDEDITEAYSICVSSKEEYSENPSGDSDGSLSGLPDGFEWIEAPTGKTDEYTSTVSGIIQNTSQKTYSYLTISFNLYDSSGNQIGSASATIRDLQAGGTWKFEATGFVGNAARFEFSSIDGF